jgi:hypothetical protein
MLGQPIEWMEKGIIAKDNVCNMRFLELERDPLTEIARMYQQFRMRLTDEAIGAMRRYLIENPRSARPAAKYQSLQSERVQSERAVLKRYQDYFGVQSEF